MSTPWCHGKVALVSGSSTGIGRCTALTLAREGAAVAVNYRTSEAAARELADAVEQRGGRAAAIRADLHQAGAARGLVTTASEVLGPIDIAVISPGGEWRMGPIDKIDAALTTQDVMREVAPALELMSLLLPGMYQRKWGRIIGMSMLLDNAFQLHALGYQVGKTARTAALLYARDQAFKHNVTVNVIAPGPVAKPDTLAAAIELCDHGPAWENRHDLCAQDIAEGITFLCSDAARHITGCQLPYVPHAS